MKEDIRKVLTTSQPWWPAHYGPFFIRMAWHSAGTYRVWGGRGGASGGEQRFETLGFADGRVDAWQPDLVFWGPETEMMMDQRRDEKGNLKGPNGNPDPLAAAADIRRTFHVMAMDDEETAALIVGGHTFGKSHGAHSVEKCLEGDPGVAGLERQGLGWANNCGKGNAEDTVGSDLEGAWSANPIAWSTQFLDNLYGFECEKHKSPAGGWQWRPTDPATKALVPDDVHHRHRA